MLDFCSANGYNKDRGDYVYFNKTSGGKVEYVG